jgi:hypothetical protein
MRAPRRLSWAQNGNMRPGTEPEAVVDADAVAVMYGHDVGRGSCNASRRVPCRVPRM